MAEINYDIYGEAEDWIDAYSSYAAGTEAKDKLQTANFGGEQMYANRISRGISEGLLEIDTPWDPTLSYCALGSKAPLSKIVWYIKQGTNEPADENILETWVAEPRSMTQFALGQSWGRITVQKMGNSIDGYYVKGDMYSNIKFKNIRWSDGAVYNNDYSNYAEFAPFTRIPLHRVVLCPVLTVSNASNDTQVWDLLEYENHKTEYNRLRQVGLQIYVDGNPALYPDINEEPLTGFARIGVSDLNEIAILEKTSAFNGMLSDYYGPLNTEETLGDIYLPITAGSKVDGSICIAGDLFGASPISSSRGGATAMRAYAGGFGLYWNKWTTMVEDKMKITGDNSYMYCDVSEFTYGQVVEAVRQMVACFGLFFIDGAAHKDVSLYDPRMMLGILDKGVGNGKYSQGEDNKNQEQWTMEDAHEIDFDPTHPPKIDPNNYDELNYYNTRPYPSQISIGSTGYFASLAQVNNIFKGFNDMYQDMGNAIKASVVGSTGNPLDPSTWDGTFADEPSKASAYQSLQDVASWGAVANPNDCIVNLILYPFDISPNYMTDDVSTIKVGSITDNLLGFTIKKVAGGTSTYSFIDLGSCSLFEEYENFLDYAPYTTCELYLPYCGSINIDPEIFCGHAIKVQYRIELQTGLITALVYRDEMLVETVDGQIGQKITMTLSQATEYFSQLFNSACQIKAQKNALNAQIGKSALQLVDTAAKAYAGDVGGAVRGTGSLIESGIGIANSLDNMKIAGYQTEAISIPFKQISVASSNMSAAMEQTPRLILYRPTPLAEYRLQGANPWNFNWNKKFKEYAHTTGYACLMNDELSKFSGLTQVASVDLSGISGATEKEKAMINAALRGGVYIIKKETS